MLKIFTVTALYAVITKHVSSLTATCISEFCFTTPGSSEMKNFDDAKCWCNAHNSTLAVVNDSETQEALTQFLNFLSIDFTTFINMKLSQHDNTWILVNGSNYNGAVGNQQINEYKLYCYLKTIGKEFFVEASNPRNSRKYLCDFEDNSELFISCLSKVGRAKFAFESKFRDLDSRSAGNSYALSYRDGTRCQNNSTSNFLFNGRCYVKYENENLTWYQARERCIINGGDLARFQSGSNSWIPSFNTSWLDTSLTYWVGIRWNGWSWKSTDDVNEIIYSSWDIGKPNNVSYSCVCVDPNGIPAWTWTDCDCTLERPFVCLKIVPTTTVTTTTTTTSMAIPTTATTILTEHALPNKSEGLIVGLVLGLVVILPLTIITVALIVCNVRLRRRLRENTGNSERATTAAKTSQVNLDRSTARLDAADPDVQYQHLKRETILGPGTSMPLYDQLNQPETRDYELTPENT